MADSTKQGTLSFGSVTPVETIAPIPAPVSASREKPLSVADLIRRASSSLDRGVGTVWVEGELAEWKRAASGHGYFQLRDGNSGVPAVIWSRDLARVRFELEVGQRLRVRGKLGVYERDGRMQLYVDFVEPAGVGVAALALEQLRAKLAAEGLFADARKRPLPKLPTRIGVVTSKHGAAVRDIIRTVERRFPVPIVIADAVVQGASAPGALVLALELIVRTGVDVVIIGRGGGSVTDLAAFNDERVVRAVAACPVPVVSAVGHEVDLSLCDLAADQRASTPTAAAELVVPVRTELAAALAKEVRRLHREIELRLTRARHDLDRTNDRAEHAMTRMTSSRRATLASLERRLAEQQPQAQLLARRRDMAGLAQRLEAQHPRRLLSERRHELATIHQRLATSVRRRQDASRADLAALAGRLHALSPLAVLERGYAVVRRGAEVIRTSREVAIGDRLDVRLAAGAVVAKVEQIIDGNSEPS